MVDYTKNVVYPDDNEMVIITKDCYSMKTLDNININKEVTTIEFELEQLEKGGFEHFMLKEIFEQNYTIENAIRGRSFLDTGNVRLGGLTDETERLRHAKRIILNRLRNILAFSTRR